MNALHPWFAPKNHAIHASPETARGFSICFDARIPPEIQTELRRFVQWVEDNFCVPVLIWVDFEYRHYLLDRERRRVGYLFYWTDIPAGASVSLKENMPVIRLPVRTEHCTLDDVLFSFIQAISSCFLWVLSSPPPHLPDDKDCELILRAYQNSRIYA